MKVKMARHSGLPVVGSVADEYRECWKSYYDKILDKYQPDMLKVQERLEKLANILNNRYKTVIEVDIPRSAKGWKALLEENGSHGICITTDLEKKEIRLILLDQGL
jgi:predicted metal-binding protein